MHHESGTPDGFNESSGKGLRVAVIGGGITGLAAAHRLLSQNQSVHVTVFEGSERLGGIIHTEHADGYLKELGPDSFITNKPGGVQLCEELGFTEQLIPTDNRFRRSLVLRKGRPLPVPDGFMLMAPAKPWAIATTPILSPVGKARLLWERFVAAKAIDDDESLASFVRRRFGAETLDRLVQPLVGGIYTSDPEKLSLKATLPRFLDMEQRFGSVIRATLNEQKSRRQKDAATSGSGARYGLFATPRDGLSSLVATLESTLRATGRISFRISTTVASVRTVNGDWLVTTEPGVESFDAVIITLPTYRAAELLDSGNTQRLAGLLQQIEYASSAIVVSGHRLSDFEHPMDAFGLVIPAKEQRKTLAVSFTSRKFPNRAPEGHILLRTFVGGAMQSELLENDDQRIRQLVERDLRDILGLKSEPVFSDVVRYQRAMPQYHVGHLERVREIESFTSQMPGFQLAGSAYHGVGIPDSITSGRSAADAILKTGVSTPPAGAFSDQAKHGDSVPHH